MSLKQYTPCDDPGPDGRHYCPFAEDGDYVNCEYWCGAEEPEDYPEEENEEEEEDIKMTMHIYPRHDSILGRYYTNAERLQPQLQQIAFMRRALDTLEYRVKNVSPRLTEAQLETIAQAVQAAYNAVENAACLGDSGYIARPVEVIRWDY